MTRSTAWTRDVVLPWLLAAVAIAMAYALTIAVTGGFTLQVAGFRLRSHSWIRPALLAAAGGAAASLLAPARAAAMCAHAAGVIESPAFARGLAVVAAGWALAAGIVFGTFAVGGADTYGYVGQARLFAHGRMTDTVALDPHFNWPGAAATLTPLGFTVGTSPGVIAPQYPPGLPLLLSPFTRWDSTIYLLVPAFGALLVWCTYRLGTKIADPQTGAFAAALIAASPTFLYQVVQPLSDVPAAACWLGALLAAMHATRGGAAASGAICAVAILIRPNLAPLAAIIAVAVTFAAPADRIRRVSMFGAAALPGILALGWIQNVRYGSPLASGYGPLSYGFSSSNVVPNLLRYPRWLTETHSWFIWAAVAAPAWIARRTRQPLAAWLAVALALATWFAYLPYTYFQMNEWHYTRFLLLAIAIMLIFASAVTMSVLRLLPRTWRAAATLAVLAGLVSTLIHAAAMHGAFTMRALERKYPLAGAFVRERLPATAFVLAAQHSGSIRYYADRPTLRWDLLAPEQLDHVLARLRAAGYEPFLVVDAGEVDVFRERFASARQHGAGQLTPLTALGDAQVFGFR
jgi:hypothetical protein